MQKNLEATILFADFSKVFNSIHRRKMEEILFANGFPKEIVAAIILRYKNTKVKVRSPDGDTDFDIVIDVLQVDKLVPYMFIICLDYVLRTSINLIKENGFNQAKERSKRYPGQTITDTNYAEFLQHSLERAAGGIGLHVNADKTEYIATSPL